MDNGSLLSIYPAVNSSSVKPQLTFLGLLEKLTHRHKQGSFFVGKWKPNSTEKSECNGHLYYFYNFINGDRNNLWLSIEFMGKASIQVVIADLASCNNKH